MTDFLLGAAAATYLLVLAYLVTDGLVQRAWEWAAVLTWPISLPLRHLYLLWRNR